MNVLHQSLLDLRILVLTLGEARHAGWWGSQFLSPIGLSFLERIYPRSTFAAAVRSAGRAARAVHDANVGKGEVFHLFRLPRQTEQEIDSALTEQSTELAAQYSALLADREALLRALEKMTNTLPATETSSLTTAVGPLRLSVSRHDWAPTLARAYHSAFQREAQVFPYFEIERTRS